MGADDYRLSSQSDGSACSVGVDHERNLNKLVAHSDSERTNRANGNTSRYAYLYSTANDREEISKLLAPLSFLRYLDCLLAIVVHDDDCNIAESFFRFILTRIQDANTFKKSETCARLSSNEFVLDVLNTFGQKLVSVGLCVC